MRSVVHLVTKVIMTLLSWDFKISRTVEVRNAYKIFVTKSWRRRRRRPLAMPGRRYTYNFKIEVKYDVNLWVELSTESSDGDLRTRLWIFGFFQAGSVLILNHGANCVLALCCNADDCFCVSCVVHPEWNAANCTAVISTTCGMVSRRRRQCQVLFQKKWWRLQRYRLRQCAWYSYVVKKSWNSVGFWGRYIVFSLY